MDKGKRLAIQFLHPGREKTKEIIIKNADGKPCQLHGRKFVEGCGDYVADELEKKKAQSQQIMFWCEYEQQLKYDKLCGRPHIDGYPRYIQTLRPACYRQSCGEIGGCINTDPYIFGRYMLYSNCRQKRSHLLKNLPGSGYRLWKQGERPFLFRHGVRRLTATLYIYCRERLGDTVEIKGRGRDLGKLLAGHGRAAAS